MLFAPGSPHRSDLTDASAGPPFTVSLFSESSSDGGCAEPDGSACGFDRGGYRVGLLARRSSDTGGVGDGADYSPARRHSPDSGVAEFHASGRCVVGGAGGCADQVGRRPGHAGQCGGGISNGRARCSRGAESAAAGDSRSFRECSFCRRGGASDEVSGGWIHRLQGDARAAALFRIGRQDRTVRPTRAGVHLMEHRCGAAGVSRSLVQGDPVFSGDQRRAKLRNFSG